MPLNRPDGDRVAVILTLMACAAVAVLALHVTDALAQSAPFGGGGRAAAPPPAADGIAGWLLSKQAEFSLAMRNMLRNAKSDGTAVWGLLGLSFLYGVFHAAGPGHGKAVISSYVVANDETWRRGVVLSFASALLQAVVAVGIVAVAAVVFNATMATMCATERYIEIASYALIALIGLRLIWVKGRAFFNTARRLGRPLHAVGAAVTPPGHDHKHDHHDHKHDHHHDHGHHHHDHAHGHGHDHHDHAHHAHDQGHGHKHGHDHHHGHGHDHHHHHHDDEEHASAWGHAHGPEPQELAGPGGWRRGLTAIVAVGLRPCSGAILVLVFALAQGLLWAGVAATFVMALGTAITVAIIATLAVWARSLAERFADSRSGYGMLALRGIEVAAAVVIFAFGSLLLAGYLYAERLPLC
jgi:nickel/cobalt exporter